MTQDEIEKAQALIKWHKKLIKNNNGWKVKAANGNRVTGVAGPNMASDLSRYPINDPKPEKIIDMSVCIKSDIDIEIHNPNNDSWQIFKFKESFNYRNMGNYYEIVKCRLREDHWYANDQCEETPPIPEGFLIGVYLLAGNDSIRYEEFDNYQDDKLWEKVIRYKILKILPDYRY